jgi:hypothetical protein
MMWRLTLIGFLVMLFVLMGVPEAVAEAWLRMRGKLEPMTEQQKMEWWLGIIGLILVTLAVLWKEFLSS